LREPAEACSPNGEGLPARTPGTTEGHTRLAPIQVPRRHKSPAFALPSACATDDTKVADRRLSTHEASATPDRSHAAAFRQRSLRVVFLLDRVEGQRNRLVERQRTALFPRLIEGGLVELCVKGGERFVGDFLEPHGAYAHLLP
jgi:hypothetical protein